MSLELFVEHLTGKPGPANEELFHHLVSTLPPRRKEAVLLHFRDGLPYKTVGGNEDSKRKLELGRRWQSAAGRKYRYFMVFKEQLLWVQPSVTGIRKVSASTGGLYIAP